MSEKNIPNHIGYIVDGNRRWAKAQGLPSFDGHMAGFNTLIDIVDETFERGVNFVTCYIFSTENWSRTKEEVKYLMGIFVKFFDEEVKKLHKKGIRVVFLGNRTKHVTKNILKLIENGEKLTAKNTRGTLSLCFNYGGQLEIVEACQKIIEKGVDATKLTVENFAKYLYHPEIPVVDLLVRTSGEQRISNFMLWRAAYSELLFLDKTWPDMAATDVDFCIDEFSRRNRRFGGN
jgi:undecaprenyl diphosphate synthase